MLSGASARSSLDWRALASARTQESRTHLSEVGSGTARGSSLRYGSHFCHRESIVLASAVWIKLIKPDGFRVINASAPRNSTSRVQSGGTADEVHQGPGAFQLVGRQTYDVEGKTEFPVIKFALTDGKRRTNILFPKVHHISRKFQPPC